MTRARSASIGVEIAALFAARPFADCVSFEEIAGRTNHAPTRPGHERVRNLRTIHSAPGVRIAGNILVLARASVNNPPFELRAALAGSARTQGVHSDWAGVVGLRGQVLMVR